MELPKNRFKAGLREGRVQLGSWVMTGNPVTTEALANTGFDWICIDMEHTTADVGDVMALLQAVASGTSGSGVATSPMVRPPWNDSVMVKRLLDIGTQSFLFPYVQTAEEAKRAVAATRYPPDGVRGAASTTRASRFGRVKDYHKRAAEEICVMVQLETRQAIAALDAIADVKGVDSVFLGPMDLAMDMGFVGQGGGNPEVRKLCAEAVKRCKARKTPIGTFVGGESDLRWAFETGFDYVSVCSDLGLVARGAEAALATWKAK